MQNVRHQGGAEAWAKDVETNMNKSLFVSAKEAEQYTLSECLDRYIEEYIPRLKHPKRETDRARFLQKRTLAHRIMATIRAKDIADLRREREAEGASGNTIRLDFALLSKLFNYARSDWGMESLTNPVALAAKPKLPPGRTRRLEPGEDERLLAACAPEYALVVRFALATAMRRGEIVGLRWQDVDIRASRARLNDTKNKESRTVPLSRAAKEVLQGLPRHISGRVFPFCPDHLSAKMADACRAAGLNDLHFHDLRHEATSRFFEHTDLDVMEIKAITGHKTLQMLARYTHLRTANLAARLDGARRGEVGRECPDL
ncbi:MAG: Integrase family [Desulfovibrionaceae bacterium]|nr:MAG: Integrase family [Desulfovibrionaceae bacterium]